LKHSVAAVIDIGSNSIKALVAGRGPAPFTLRKIFERTLEVRISTGIGGSPPMLTPEGIDAGIRAVGQLWRACREYAPAEAFRIVATSAARSCANGNVFTDGIARTTGIQPTILSGQEEAEAIAIGVLTDPGIRQQMETFTLFDLGGGSLELIRFKDHAVRFRTSLPLGAVRLTERFLEDPTVPVPQGARKGMEQHIGESLLQAEGRLHPPLVGCGGGLAALRAIHRQRQNLPDIGEQALALPRETIFSLEAEVMSLGLADRMALPGMPPGRADILPAALTVFRILLDQAGADAIHHSFHNLRYGLAFQLLQ
jgi:exopolyphosphatase/guanosine-5'-triphosphate,3'-diphosphate pyrophosphatase